MQVQAWQADYLPYAKERAFMFFRISKKLIVVCVAAVALVFMVGLGTAVAAQRHADAPAHFASTFVPLVAYATPAATTRHLIGTIQSVDQAKKTFTLLVTGQTKAITIAFDAKTNIHSRQQAFKLVAKAQVMVDVSTRSNGSFYAVEVEPVPAYAHGMGHGGPGGACAPGTMQRTRY
jgi:hypothetical protein